MTFIERWLLFKHDQLTVAGLNIVAHFGTCKHNTFFLSPDTQWFKMINFIPVLLAWDKDEIPN